MATTKKVTEMGEKVMKDVVGICTALLYEKNNEKHTEITTETNSLETEYWMENSRVEYTNRVESKIEKLRMKWAGSEYEIVLEKLEMLESWKTEEDVHGVKEEILDWMISNKEVTLMEEGEDILDGLEVMEGCGEVSGTLLLDITEIITALTVARNLDTSRMIPTFQQDGNSSKERLGRIGRAKSMTKVRDEMMKLKDIRKPEALRRVTPEDFPDLEVKRVKRREAPNRMESNGLDSRMTRNSLIQDYSQKIQIVGSVVEALYPSLEAVEVAHIVYKAIMETEVKFAGVDYQEGCRLIA